MPCHAMPFDADAVILRKTEVHGRKKREKKRQLTSAQTKSKRPEWINKRLGYRFTDNRKKKQGSAFHPGFTGNEARWQE